MGTVHGPNAGVGTWIERRARTAPEAPALTAAGRRLTYADLATRIRRLANALKTLGLGRGDRVAWLGPNDPAFLETLFASGLLGAVLAPVNHRLPSDEQAFVLADSEPTVVVAHRSVVLPAMPKAVRHVLIVGAESAASDAYEAHVSAAPDDDVAAPVSLDDLFMLPHTSGTTGRPKGVMLTHANVTWNVVNFLTCADFRGDDVTIAIAPFFRVGGTGVNVLPTLFMGGSVVVPDAPEPDRLLALMEEHRVTVGFGNPDLLDALTRSERWPTADLAAIRFILTGGAPVPDRLVRTWFDRGVPLLQGYGLSEAAPLALLLNPATARRKVGSAGRPPLLVDVRIVDADGNPAPTGDTGELLVRGPNVMAGYWRRPEDTRDALLPDGWLRTGDAARMDADGEVWIVDRVEAGFRTAGGVVYPGDVERALMAHPAVVDAGVVGIPSEEGAERAVAFIVAAAGSDVGDEALLDAVRRTLPVHAIPAAIHRVSALPRSSVGKLLRHEMVALATAT